MKECLYALGGLNYKNGTVTVCPRQADQLVFQKDTVLPSEIFNHENFKALRQKLYNDEWPAGCDTCMNMEDVGVESMRHDFLLEEDGIFYKNAGRPKTNPSPATMSYYRRYHKERVPDNFYLIDCYDKNTHYVKPEGLRHVELRLVMLVTLHAYIVQRYFLQDGKRNYKIMNQIEKLIYMI